jgi:predicted O-methyltransferase YrrM
MDPRDWRRALGSFARNLRHKAFIRELATSGLRFDAAPQAIEASFFDMYAEARGQVVPMGDVCYRLWNMDPVEHYCLAAIAAVREPQNIFEIGTFDGATSLLLAQTVPKAKVYTLDLPAMAIEYQGVQRAQVRASETFALAPEGARITQLHGDSRVFDFSPYYNKMDLVVVDGSHEADCVVPDTENALRMVAAGGMVVWDDYSCHHPDVVAAVDSAAKRDGLFVMRLVPTGFAIYDTTKSPAETPPTQALGVHRVRS